METHRGAVRQPAVRRRWVGPSLLALAYLVLSLTYGVVAPPFESPDEIGHFFTAKYIADYRHLPIPEKALSEQYLYGQESTQPPLYYLLGALLLRLSGSDTEDAWSYLRVNPHTTCGSPHLAGNKAFLAHDPARERFPWTGSIVGLHLLRLFSTLLGLATVLGVYAAARLCFPGQELLAATAAGATALNPQFLFVSAGVNNDNLLVALCTWSMVLLLRMVRHGVGRAGIVGSGVLIGLAAMTKLGGVLLLPLAALAILFAAWERYRSMRHPALWSTALRGTLGVAALALAVSGWWYGRNAWLYHDPTLIEHHLAIVSRRDPTPLRYILHEVPSIFYSYWGRFTCDLSPGAWYYAFWGAVVTLGLAGVLVAWRGLDRVQRAAFVVLALWFGLVFAGWFRWNLLASGVQGRLLFPATLSVSLLTACGWLSLLEWLRTRLPRGFRPASELALRGGSGVLMLAWAGLALWVLFGLIRPTFAPPNRLRTLDGLDAIERVEGSFAAPAGEVALLGYAVQPRDPEADGTLEVRLYLSARQPLTDTYSLGVWLVSAIPGDTTRLAGLDTWPGNGNYPTNVWQPGEIVEDVYRIALPADVPRTQAWAVQLNMYRAGREGWFPFSLAGQPAGDRAILGLVRVGASERLSVPPDAVLTPPPVFGEWFALRGARADALPGERQVRVTLWWEALGVPAADYTVFVHLVDGAGQLRATGDGPPLWGGFPTSMWRPGDVVEDEHVVALPADLPAGQYHLRVGWYEPESGARLGLSAAGDSWDLGVIDIHP
jgi:4-amino-4-deoxy-L-arabinose transferase-like glycosyltransferase